MTHPDLGRKFSDETAALLRQKCKWNPDVQLIVSDGLSSTAVVSESLSAYMTYGGYVGIPEANRTVVSNIHQSGTNPAEAGAHIASLIVAMLEHKASGLDFRI